MYASQKGRIKVVEALLNNGADVNARTTDGKTALQFASKKGYAEVKELLIKAGAN